MGEIAKKEHERSLRLYPLWASIEKRRIICGKIVMVMEVSWKRRRGCPKRKWLDNIRNDLSEKELSGDEAQCLVNWKRLIRNVDPTYNVKGCVKGRQFLFT